jgi:hypothetical protein
VRVAAFERTAEAEPATSDQLSLTS